MITRLVAGTARDSERERERECVWEREIDSPPAKKQKQKRELEHPVLLVVCLLLATYYQTPLR